MGKNEQNVENQLEGRRPFGMLVKVEGPGQERCLFPIQEEQLKGNG